MRAAITGGRHRTPSSYELLLCSWHIEYYGVTELSHGDYPDDLGTDRYVSRWAKTELGLLIRPFPVDLRIDGPWPGAGPRRSGRMLNYRDPITSAPIELLFSFPGDRGTASCTQQARLMGLRVEVIPEIS